MRGGRDPGDKGAGLLGRGNVPDVDVLKSMVFIRGFPVSSLYLGFGRWLTLPRGHETGRTIEALEEWWRKRIWPQGLLPGYPLILLFIVLQDFLYLGQFFSRFLISIFIWVYDSLVRC